MPRKSIVFLLIIIVCILVACEEELFVSPFPGVKTNAIEEITVSGAEASGEIVDSKGYSILDHGFIYYKEDLGATNPLEKYEKISLGVTGGDGKFSAIIGTNLASQTNYIVKAYALIGDRTIYGTPRGFKSLGGLSPELINFYPDTANIGDTLTLRVNHISRQRNKNIVYFDNSEAQIVSVDDSIMKVIVPRDLSVATCPLKIQTGEKISLSTKSFGLIKPAIDSLSKIEAFLGDRILLYGKNYYGVTGVKIDDQDMVGMTVEKNFISFVLPQTLQQGSHVLSLKQLNRTIAYPNHFKVLYPEVESIVPTTVWLDSIVTVKGKYLNHMKNLKIGDRDLNLVIANDSTIKAKITFPFPKSQIKYSYGDLQLNVKDELSFLLPEITSLSKSSGVNKDEIIIKGNNLDNRIYIKIGESMVPDCQYYDNKTMSFLVPPLKAGTYTINFYCYPECLMAESNKTFTVLPVVINNISRQASYGGGSFEVGLGNVPGNDIEYEWTPVYLDDIRCEANYLGNGVFQVKVPNIRFINEKPNLKVEISGQTVTKDQAIQIVEPWELIYQSNNDLKSSWNWKLINCDSNVFVDRTTDGYSAYYQFISSNNVKEINRVQNAKKFNWDLIVNGNIYSEGFKYSLDMSTKESITAYPVFQSTHEEAIQAISFVIGGKAYVGNYDVFNVYDPATNSWQPKSRIPLNSLFNVAKTTSFSYNGKGYFIEENNLWEYNPDSDHWSLKAYLPGVFHGIRSACLHGSNLFILADKLYEFNLDTFQLTEFFMPPWEEGEQLIGVLFQDNVLYGIGEKGNYLNVNSFSDEKYDLIKQLRLSN